MYVVDTIFKVASKKNWDGVQTEPFREEIKRWLMLLLTLVDFNQKPQECLELMLSKSYLVAKEFEGFIGAKV